MKNILVAIDFSHTSLNAAKYALLLAQPFNANVTLVNVVAPPVVLDDSILAFVMTTQAEILTSHNELMEKEVEKLSHLQSSKISGIVKEGYPLETIIEVSESLMSDLIVMGRKGKGNSSSLFGSTTTAIVRKGILPVFVIPENAKYEFIDNITFATDFNPETEREKYSLLVKLAKKYDSFVRILNVQKNVSEMNEDEFIGKMKSTYAFSDLKYSFETIQFKTVIDGITHFLEENTSDILVMMSHPHSFFERIIRKTHTREMSYQTKIPLLILPGN
ncbi:MAG: universal stress protein [Ginsengibacter sp.]|jgi:nucleotide-binding universal stress UspA family protein